MKTLAQFKRDAATGKMSLELLERFGNTDIPEHQKGIRKVVKTNTVGLQLANPNGQISYLDYLPASLTEYDRETLVMYASEKANQKIKKEPILKYRVYMDV